MQKKIIKMNWENANPHIPMVLMTKKQRKEIDVDVQNLVDVKYQDKATKAIVYPQFRDLLKQDGVTTNQVLTNTLGCGLFEVVDISKSEMQLPPMPNLPI